MKSVQKFAVALVGGRQLGRLFPRASTANRASALAANPIRMEAQACVGEWSSWDIRNSREREVA